MSYRPSEVARAVSNDGVDSKRIQCRVFRHGEAETEVRHLHEISEILEKGGSVVWLDVVDPGTHDLDTLQEEFGLHPLAIEDAIQAHQRPKIESYGAYFFLDVRAITAADEDLVFHEIAIFVGANFLITVRHDPAFPLSEIERRWQSHPEEMRRGSGFLLYTILDIIVDGYVPIADAFDEQVDRLEEQLFDRSGSADEQSILSRIFHMKSDSQEFRRATFPMRDILLPITRGDLRFFTPEEIVYYRDVYDHAVRVTDQIDLMRDSITSALEIQLSVSANRQGDVTRQLTVIATIFLPLSFIVGFFGQNFGFMINHISSPQSFWSMGLAPEILTVVGMLIYFKRKGWF